jgi:hypothetical protein
MQTDTADERVVDRIPISLLIRDITSDAFALAMAEIGEEEFFRSMRPHLEHGALAFSMNAQQEGLFNPMGPILASRLCEFMGHLADGMVFSSHEQHGEIMVTRISRCAMCDDAQLPLQVRHSLCRFECDAKANAVYDLIQPEYSLVNIRNRVDGGDECVNLSILKGAPIPDIDIVGLPRLPLLQYDDKVQSYLPVAYLLGFWSMILQVLFDEIGEERATALLTPKCRERGRQHAKVASCPGGADGLSVLLDQLLMEYSVAEVDAHEDTLVVHSCLLAASAPGVCSLMEETMNGILESGHGPGPLQHTSMVTRGDALCSLKHKKEQGMKGRDEAIKLLRRRLTSGEIGLDEYDKLMLSLHERDPPQRMDCD